MFGRQMPLILGAYHSSSWFPAPAKFVYLLVVLYKLPSSKKITKSPREWLGNTMFFFDHLATLTRTDNEQESTAQLAKSPQFGAAKVYERNSHNTTPGAPQTRPRSCDGRREGRMNGGWSKSPDHPGIDFMKVNIIFVLWGTALPTF